MTLIGTTAAESFQTPLILEYVDGLNWVVKEEFDYASPRMKLKIPVNFQTDFASIPRFFWRIITPEHRWIGKPSIVHDYLYRTSTAMFTRRQADYELYEAMNCVGAPKLVRLLVWAAVRLFGSGAYQKRSYAR